MINDQPMTEHNQDPCWGWQMMRHICITTVYRQQQSGLLSTHHTDNIHRASEDLCLEMWDVQDRSRVPCPRAPVLCCALWCACTEDSFSGVPTLSSGPPSTARTAAPWCDTRGYLVLWHRAISCFVTQGNTSIRHHVVHIHCQVQKRWGGCAGEAAVWGRGCAGSQDKAELVSKARPAAEAAAAAGGHKVRFDSVGEEERPSSQGRRRLRGRNIVHHSDVEVASSVAAASVVSDNTHLYRRSRSAVSSKHIRSWIENVLYPTKHWRLHLSKPASDPPPLALANAPRLLEVKDSSFRDLAPAF